MRKIFAILALVGSISTADPGFGTSALPPKFPGHSVPSPDPVDPFLAGALGFLPFASGFYISQNPERGLVFSLLDVLLTLGVYTSLHSKSGDPDHVPVYYALIGVNNIADAYFSVQEALHSPVRPQVKVLPHGGMEYSIAWSF